MYTNTTQKIRGSTLYKKESQDNKENHNNNDMEIISVNTVRKIGMKITQMLIIQCTIYYIDGKVKRIPSNSGNLLLPHKNKQTNLMIL